MEISEKQIAAVTALPGPERYKHFVKVVADREEVWGLKQDGWALAATDRGDAVMPLWPARQYAELCATDDWSGYAATAIALDEFMNEFMQRLDSEGILPAIFATPQNKGVTPSTAELRADLERELTNY